MINLNKILNGGDPIVTVVEVPVRDPANKPEKPVTIALLADLHDCLVGDTPDDLPALIGQYAPDLIICAGDMVTAKAGISHMNVATDLLKTLCEKYPVYLSDGNHESRLQLHPEVYPGLYRAYSKSLVDMGAVRLNNRSRIIKVNGMKMAVHGFVQELRSFNRVHPGKITVEDLNRELGDVSACGEHGFHLLIAHRPYHFHTYARWGADLPVSGHLHGGIIRLPKLGGVFGSTFKPFPKYDKGQFSYRNKEMIVSAGLGHHSFAVRVNNPPELVIIRLG